jgi:hypothetical protein
MRDGDTLVLVFPDGTEAVYTAKFGRYHYGHGTAVLAA